MTDDELRMAVLRFTYDRESIGSEMELATHDYVEGLGLDNSGKTANAIRSAVRFLFEGRWIDTFDSESPMSGDKYVVTGLTPRGRDMYHHPERFLHSPASAVTQHFNAPVGAVQTGSQNTAHVTQNIGSEAKTLVSALEALRRELETDEEAVAANALAAQAISEITNSGTVTARARSFIEGMGRLIETLGATPAAYDLVVKAAHLFQIMLPH